MMINMCAGSANFLLFPDNIANKKVALAQLALLLLLCIFTDDF